MKIKIEIEIDVDVKEIFSRIPEGLFNGESDMVTDRDASDYLIEALDRVLGKPKAEILMGKMDMLAHNPDMVKYNEHHYEVEYAIAEQLSQFKIIKFS